MAARVTRPTSGARAGAGTAVAVVAGADLPAQPASDPPAMARQSPAAPARTVSNVFMPESSVVPESETRATPSARPRLRALLPLPDRRHQIVPVHPHQRVERKDRKSTR